MKRFNITEWQRENWKMALLGQEVGKGERGDNRKGKKGKENNVSEREIMSHKKNIDNE